MKHTPGPWHTHNEMVHAKFQIEGQGFHYAVANALEHSRVNQPTMKANARLIAATPDLLEACKAGNVLINEVFAEIEENTSSATMLRLCDYITSLEAAISKAEVKT